MVPDSPIRNQLMLWRYILGNVWVWRVILFGIPLILLWGVLGVFIPVVKAEFRYQAELTKQNLVAVFPAGAVPDLSWVPLPVWVSEYSLEVPKIGVRETVIEAVDATSETAYMSALNRGVAHAAGTGLPGAGGTQYYFAHSSGLPFWGERAVVFALLHKLELGDEVRVYRNGEQFVYGVTDKLVVQANEVQWLLARGGDERVVLQTCWPIGTNWKRLLVVAEKKT